MKGILILLIVSLAILNCKAQDSISGVDRKSSPSKILRRIQGEWVNEKDSTSKISISGNKMISYWKDKVSEETKGIKIRFIDTNHNRELDCDIDFGDIDNYCVIGPRGGSDMCILMAIYSVSKEYLTLGYKDNPKSKLEIYKKKGNQ